MMLNSEAVLEAAHACYALAYANEAEELGRSFSQQDITEAVDKLPAEKQAPIVYYYLGRIAEAWGHDIGLVFYHAGIGEDEQERALRHLLLGCMGQGISLADDHSEALAKAEAVLGRTFKPSPIYFEGTEWLDLAIEQLTCEGAYQ
jgi:hypothetical protein